MLSTSVILVLREVMEAALVVSLLLGIARRQRLQAYWIVVGLLLGGLFASLYSWQLAEISDWFDGVGQEIINGTLLVMVYLLFLVLGHSLVLTARLRMRLLVKICIVLTMALILTHEGGELIVYWRGSLPQHASTVLAGSAIGLGIGFSAGALFYYLVVVRFADNTVCALQFLLGMVAAGMILQASQFYIQADWLPGGRPLWDLSHQLPESSLAGQLLYALLGYEATPATGQVVVYVISLALFWTLPWLLVKVLTQSRELSQSRVVSKSDG